MNDLKEFLKDSKNSAKLQLLIYGILVVIIIIFIRINNMLNKDEIKVNDNNMISADKNDDLNNDGSELLLSSVKDNYEYRIDIEIKNYDKIENISYFGIKYNNEEIITKTNNNFEEKFYVNNGEYNKIVNDNYEKVNKEYVYDVINAYYLEFDNICNYIEKGVQEDNIYLIRIDKIVNNSDNREYIIIEDNTVENDINLEIDYTNLLKNNDIISCKVKYIITKINQVDDQYFTNQKVIEK